MEESNCVVVEEFAVADEEAQVYSVQWNPDDTLIAAGCSDGFVKLYTGNNGAFVRQLNCRVSHELMPVTGIRWRPTSSSAKTKNILLTTTDGGITHWHTTSGKVLHIINLEEVQ